MPASSRRRSSRPGSSGRLRGRGGTPFSILFGRQRIANLDALIVDSAIALAGMTLASGLLGWVVAGRVLRPLRAITTVTEEISETNLSERLAMRGPRDELRRLADTIDGLLARLDVAFDAQRRFVANASHELRTPLTRMRAALHVAIAKPGGVPPQVQALDAGLREDLDLADHLFESFLTLAHAQNGQLGEHAQVSLAEIVDGALAGRRAAIAAKAIVVEATLAPITLAGSETLLRRMVDNVIENAALYSPPHGLIRVALGTRARRGAARGRDRRPAA
jgi:signal transduction histidine kinase